jgi:hypothetical protein
MTAVAVGIAAGVYLALTAILQNRALFPKTYDEASYTIQARQFAAGRLAFPQHELADFFDAPNLLVRPVYASAYFPGAALMFLPGVLVGLPTFLAPLLISAACAGLLYRVVAEAVDGLVGLAAVVLLLGANVFRMLSVMPMSQPPMLLLGLAIVWAYFRYRDAPRWTWAVALGGFAGCAMVTRPVDSLCFIVPVVGALILQATRRDGAITPRTALRHAAVAACAAAPFLLFQLALDHRVTGSAFRSPFALYIDADQPGTAFGFRRFDPAARPRSVVAQKQVLYRDWVVPFIQRHQPDAIASAWLTRYLPLAVDAILPSRLLLAFLPLGLLGLAGPRRRVIAATLPLFLLLYLGYAFFLEHYALSIAPAVFLLIVLAPSAVERAWPRFRRRIATAFTLGVVALTATSLYEVTGITDESFPSPVLRAVNENLPALTNDEPAIVLFRFHPGVNNPQEEPVFNADVPWPDNAPVVRAHDLGDRNRELFEYYARRSPDRAVYLYDRQPIPQDPLGTITRLGRVSELARKNQ